ncbi:MAG: hypothetical protein L6Q37_13035 [Bdellovibrionaceae bacterium]|nr:hypothetical protein [Pseudobdellovibrionaceae bacterium]NUM59943.1 hypothetical protein [Pseudobdellovibrionaceae bacterium]
MIFLIRLLFWILLICFSLVNRVQAKEKKVSIKEQKNWTLEKLEEYQKSQKNENQFYGLGEILEKAHQLRNWDKVAYYAHVYLTEAEKYKKNWNYGNAIFDSNMALSEMAYIKGDKVTARNHLIKASQTPGSPQLDSFGPFNANFLNKYLLLLAKEGEKESLIQFAQNCKNFVSKKSQKNENQESQIVQWNLNSIDRFIEQVRGDKIPDFKTPAR